MAVACFSLCRRTSGPGSCTSAGLHPTPQCYRAPPPYFRGSPEGCFKRAATISGGGRETLAASLCCVNWPRRLRVLLTTGCDSFDAMKKWIVRNGVRSSFQSTESQESVQQFVQKTSSPNHSLPQHLTLCVP